jgi:formyl-CoA transferase
MGRETDTFLTSTRAAPARPAACIALQQTSFSSGEERMRAAIAALRQAAKLRGQEFIGVFPPTPAPRGRRAGTAHSGAMTTTSSSSPAAGPLAGLKVVELGQLIAGPFAARTLGDFGAEVIKIEPPGTGDPLRTWRLLKDGTSVWWQVQSRNKRSLALDLRQPEAQAIMRQLAAEADVLVENFRPGAMEGWGLGPDALLAANPGLVMLRISGYGQTGPYRDRPGFGVVAEAMGGLRHLTGEPGRVPVRVGVSIGDTLASLHGVIGVLMAMQHRHATVSAEHPKGKGQVIDVALYEAVFNCMESLLPEYGEFGAVREAAGSALPGIAPTNAYRCADGGYAIVAGNGDSIFRRLMECIGRPDLAADPALAGNTGRVAQVEMLDAAIGDWAAQRTVEEVLAALDAAHVPAGRIYSIADIAADPHYAARGMLQQLRMPDGSALAVPGFVPKLSLTPASHRYNAPALGADTDAVLKEIGLSAQQIAALHARGIVGSAS